MATIIGLARLEVLQWHQQKNWSNVAAPFERDRRNELEG
jgi:hypothetical protein